jgi:hypothetical protein
VLGLSLENEFLTVFMNYGMAGLILFVFYKLISNELSQLRNAIEKLDDKIDNLSRKIERLIVILDERREDDKR